MAKDIGKNKSEIAVDRVLAGERTKDVARDLDITPQAIYCALKNRNIKIKKARNILEQKTKRITAHLAPHVLNTLDAGIDPDLGGRSARLNGVIERFEVVYEDNIDEIRALFSDRDIINLVDAHLSSGRTGSWLQDWAANEVDMISDIKRISSKEALNNAHPLLRQVLTLSGSQAAVLEEYLARETLKLQS